MKLVTITSQGQITLPAQIRKAMNLHESDKLEVTYDPQTRRVSLVQPMSFDAITQRARAAATAQKPPLIDAHEYYERERLKTMIDSVADE